MSYGRSLYMVCYDICDPRRLRAVYQCMRGFGDHVQLSVFLCELSKAEYVRMKTALGDVVHAGEDQVLMIPLGPVGGTHARGMETIGAPLAHPERYCVVV